MAQGEGNNKSLELLKANARNQLPVYQLPVLQEFPTINYIDYRMDVSASLEFAFVIRTWSCQLSQQMNLKIQPLHACPFLLHMVGIYSTNPGWC